jgi:hypothetical protein
LTNQAEKSINLLSLDIQGMEADAFRGMERSSPQLILVETREHNFWEVCELLIQKSFTLVGDLTSIHAGNLSLDHTDLFWITNDNSILVEKSLEAIRNYNSQIKGNNHYQNLK